MPSAAKPSGKTAQVALALFARCLAHGKWPDRVEFTKYLYLLDWAHYRMKGALATDIQWKFFHYGPWSEDVIPAMEHVQSVFQLGWVDYSTEERDVPEVDVVVEKLGLTLESLISRIITAFAKKDTSAVIDFCYRLTEPMTMTHAKRGELLDFSTVNVTGEAPVFSSPTISSPMPQLTTAQEEARKKFRARASANRAKFEKWKSLMEQKEYLDAMARLAEEREATGENIPKGIQVRLSDDAINHLDDLSHE